MEVQNKRIIASILFVLISFVCAAQTVPPPPLGPAPVGLPIDGGIVGGIFVAIFYGVKKLLKRS